MMMIKKELLYPKHLYTYIGKDNDDNAYNRFIYDDDRDLGSCVLAQCCVLFLPVLIRAEYAQKSEPLCSLKRLRSKCCSNKVQKSEIMYVTLKE